MTSTPGAGPPPPRSDEGDRTDSCVAGRDARDDDSSTEEEEEAGSESDKEEEPPDARLNHSLEERRGSRRSARCVHYLCGEY